MLGTPAERRSRLAASALTLATLVLSAVVAAPASAADVTCDKVAAPTGSDSAAGTLAAPYRTAQKLADSLGAGQTGCLRAGTYSAKPYVLRAGHGGTSGAPLAIRSYPGEKATLQGVTFVTKTAPFVTLSDLDFVGTDDDADATNSMPVSVQLMAADTVFERNTITNNHIKSCMITGSNGGWGQAIRLVIRGNVFHDCGSAVNGMLDHAIYFENTDGVDVSDNLFYDNQAYAIHLYPNSHGVHVHHNVMDSNGGGVVFAGSSSYASGDNLVEHNLITRSKRDYNINYWWGGAIGTGNVASTNCLWLGSKGDVVGSPKGFTSTGNVSANPAYADAAAHDFRIPAGSPCMALVGYDIAAKVLDLAAAPAPPAPTPTPTPTPTPDPTVTPAPSPAPTSSPDPTPPVSPPPVDAPPAVTITSPVEGATFAERLSITADAADDHGVARVELWVDGVLRTTDYATAWGFDWKAPRGVKVGNHTVIVKAVDTAGQAASASMTIRRTSTKPSGRAASLRKKSRRARSKRARRAAARRAAARRAAAGRR